MALPELYQEQTFNKEGQFRKMYGTNASKRDARRFNRYWNSSEKERDEAAFIQEEMDKRAKSWDDRIAAAKEQNAARAEEALRRINTSLAAKPIISSSQEVPVHKVSDSPINSPVLGTDWNKVAKRHGFSSMKEVADWQATNGLIADGKFGEKSKAKWHELERNRKASESPAISTEPVQNLTQKPTEVPVRKRSGISLAQFENHKNFRPHHTDFKTVTIDGVTYPIRVTTDMYGNDVGIENDHTYAYDSKTGMIRKVRENWAGLPQSEWSRGTEWFDPSLYIAGFKKQGGTMNRINYFQQGGAAPQQDIKAQVTALVQAAMQGDQKATQQVNQIMEAAKAGDQQAIQIAQIMEQVLKELQGQATSAKWGSKLNYIKSLKFAKGGKTCPACENGGVPKIKASTKYNKKIEEKACGGKAKKKYFGGLV